jgi:hypothetical protein
MSFILKQIETKLTLCFYLFQNETHAHLCSRVCRFVGKNLLYQKRCLKMLAQSLLFPADRLARISHKYRRERPISAVDTGKRRLRGAGMKTLAGRVCPECFWGCR